MRLGIIALATGLAILVNLAVWYGINRPIQVAAMRADEKLSSVSFAPFRRGQSPLTLVYPTAQQIEEDLAALQGRVTSVRTYASREGLDTVPRVAGKYGIKVTMGAWLGRSLLENDAEIGALINLANRHPDSINRVIVGNEVLLRRDLPADALAAQIRRVKLAVKQPVSYADVWEFWIRNAQLAKEVDFITVHLLPYWEDQPVGVSGAMQHIDAIYERVRQAFPNKPIVIGEVGWPTAGRAREAAVPGRAMQAQFLRQFTDLARDRRFDYNVVEAFDQPWKTAQEGTVGGNWGILDAERKPKHPPGGPVQENPHWPMAFAGAALLGAAAMILVLPVWPGTAAAFLLAFFAQGLASMLAVSAQHGVAVWHDKSTYAAPLLQFALQGLLAAFMFREASLRLARAPEPVPFRGAGDFWKGSLRDLLLGVFGLLALYETVLLALRPDLPAFSQPLSALPDQAQYWLHRIFNGRYRDFPLAEFLVPTIGLGLFILLLATLGRRPQVLASSRPLIDGLFVAVIALAAATMCYVENFRNTDAFLWAACAAASALLSLAAAKNRWRRD